MPDRTPSPDDPISMTEVKLVLERDSASGKYQMSSRNVLWAVNEILRQRAELKRLQARDPAP